MNKLYKTVAFSVLLAGNCTNAFAENEADIDKLMDLSLKELTQIEVTSVSKRAEKANETAAAISVITAEDIRRSGATTVPEVLRGIPGVQVARINAGWWAITARGNANQFGNKLLVLLDGRSIYNPMFSGASWEEQGTPLEDIERIEVIRGPGATLWGANAVNGVINITTKNSKDTEGNLLAAGAGDFDGFSGYARHGGKLGEDATYRSYLNHYSQNNSETGTGIAAYDDWQISRAGTRVDGKIDEAANYTISSDVYSGTRNLPFMKVPEISGARTKVDLDKQDMYGGNLIAKYSRKNSEDSNLDIQAYYDYVGRDAEVFGQNIQTFDLDAQNTFNLTDNHQFIVGAGYRLVDAEMDKSILIRYPYGTGETTQLFSSFVQDKIQLVPNELYLTLGSKFEYNTYTDFEWQPNARIAWIPDGKQTIWGAVTRAVRTPSIIERNLTQVVAATPAKFIAIEVNPKLQSEELIAYEIGYRNQPTTNLSFDATAFINKYDNLRTLESAAGLPIDADILGVASLIPRNFGERTTVGFELASNYEVNKDWLLSANYSFLDMDMATTPGSTDTSATSEDRKSPNHMINLRSHYAFNDQWEMDNYLSFVSQIKGSTGDSDLNIPSYYRFDAKLTWKPSEGVETSLVGQNLLDDKHQEFGSSLYSVPYQIPRSVFGKVTLRF